MEFADAENILRRAGLRVTAPRMAVLRAVQSNPHARTDLIITAARAELPDVSHQAVYDVLHRLTTVGLLRCIQPAGSPARYEARIGDNHHHAICRGCGAVADIDCAVGEAPCLTPSDDHGFAIDAAEVVYWGTCPNCSSANVTAPDNDRPIMEGS
jgi:Fur family ferric uptake transcriptional regulator